MCYADFIQSAKGSLYYSFQPGEEKTLLILGLNPEEKITFQVEIPDEKGKQTDRLKLPCAYISRKGAVIAQQVFDAAVNNFIDRAGRPLKKKSPFPDFSVKIDHPERPGKTSIWARHLCV